MQSAQPLRDAQPLREVKGNGLEQNKGQLPIARNDVNKRNFQFQCNLIFLFGLIGKLKGISTPLVTMHYLYPIYI